MANNRIADLPGTAVAAGFAVLAGYVLIEGRGMSTMGAVFPNVIGTVMLVLSIVIVVRNLMRPRVAPVPPPASAESMPRRVAFIAAMAVWTALIPVLGFYIASLLAFAAILVVAMHERGTWRHWAMLGAIGFVIVTAFTLLMSKVLLIPLPQGIL